MDSKSEFLMQAEGLTDSDFHQLDMETKNQILVQWVRADRKMRVSGQEKPEWDGKVPLSALINKEVVAKTEKGDIVGKAIYVTTIEDRDGVFRQAICVHVPSSGSILQLPGRMVRPASDDDRKRMQTDVTFARRLAQADLTANEIVREKRSRTVAGTHLLDRMLDEVRAKKLIVDQKSGYHKISGNAKGVCVYLAIKGGRADLSGFCVDDVGVRAVSEEEAKAKHIGKVRGQIDFNRDDSTVMGAWKKVLDVLC